MVAQVKASLVPSLEGHPLGLAQLVALHSGYDGFIWSHSRIGSL